MVKVRPVKSKCSLYFSIFSRFKVISRFGFEDRISVLAVPLPIQAIAYFLLFVAIYILNIMKTLNEIYMHTIV